jgi:hypothetical protein
MRNLRKATAALALIVALGLSVTGLAPAASASEEGNGYVYLYDTHSAYAEHGIANHTLSSNWRFYCEAPSYVALDESSGYWNFTVYVDCLDTTTASGPTFKVYLYIYDGTTNLSANSGSIRVDNSTRVYGNISIAQASYEVMVQNSSADLYIKLVNGTTPTTLKDYYSMPGGIQVETLGVIGMVWMLVPMIMVLGLMSGLMGFMGDVMGKSKHEGKHHKKKR